MASEANSIPSSSNHSVSKLSSRENNVSFIRSYLPEIGQLMNELLGIYHFGEVSLQEAQAAVAELRSHCTDGGEANGGGQGCRERCLTDCQVCSRACETLFWPAKFHFADRLSRPV